MIITVTAEDIARGKPNYLTSCPIALALKREIGEEKSVIVDCDTVTVDGVPFLASKRMCDFIERFDAGGKVYPTRFRLIHF